MHTLEKAESFKKICKNPSECVLSKLSKEREGRIRQNTCIITSLMKCIIFSGSQGISLRGHRDDATCEDNGKMGNFGS